MTSIRNILTAVALVALTAITLAAAARTLVEGIPASTNFGRSALVDIVANRDLELDGEDEQRQLARRLEREMRRNPQMLDTIYELDDVSKQRFLANAVDLAHVSFLQKMRQYESTTDPARRDRFLDRQIDDILSWAPLLSDPSMESARQSVGMTALPIVVRRIDEWKREADFKERVRIERYLTALRARVSARLTKSIMPW